MNECFAFRWAKLSDRLFYFGSDPWYQTCWLIDSVLKPIFSNQVPILISLINWKFKIYFFCLQLHESNYQIMCHLLQTFACHEIVVFILTIINHFLFHCQFTTPKLLVHHHLGRMLALMQAYYARASDELQKILL